MNCKLCLRELKINFRELRLTARELHALRALWKYYNKDNRVVDSLSETRKFTA